MRRTNHEWQHRFWDKGPEVGRGRGYAGGGPDCPGADTSCVTLAIESDHCGHPMVGVAGVLSRQNLTWPFLGSVCSFEAPAQVTANRSKSVCLLDSGAYVDSDSMMRRNALCVGNASFSDAKHASEIDFLAMATRARAAEKERVEEIATSPGEDSVLSMQEALAVRAVGSEESSSEDTSRREPHLADVREEDARSEKAAETLDDALRAEEETSRIRGRLSMKSVKRHQPDGRLVLAGVAVLWLAAWLSLQRLQARFRTGRGDHELGEQLLGQCNCTKGRERVRNGCGRVGGEDVHASASCSQVSGFGDAFRVRWENTRLITQPHGGNVLGVPHGYTPSSFAVDHNAIDGLPSPVFFTMRQGPMGICSKKYSYNAGHRCEVIPERLSEDSESPSEACVPGTPRTVTPHVSALP
eukprot:TRINITY_DN21302_c0_g1_i1.p1 TRINITY_DN21302_c0_g1~~TRINITY_DN21302_c0_g1_i1.p1  ORF type:complete len:412 (-),score=49.05 TRINITY_DN21302_c0_g1_i1:229-1464(-)